MGMFDRLGSFFEGGEDGSFDADAGDADGGPDESTAGPDRFAADARDAVERWDDLELDFSVDSLARVEEYAREQGDPAGDRDGEAVQLGAYFGEVLVRQFDGEWVRDDGWSVAVPGSDGPATVPVFDVATRSLSGQPEFVETAEAVAAAHEPPGVLDALEDGPFTGETPEGAAIERYRVSAADPSFLERLATTLADTWPEYDLDRSPASLARLDDLLETEFDDPPAQTGAFGAYVGEVFVDAHGGTWIEDDDAGWVVELPDSGGRLSIPLVLEECLSGEATFASLQAGGTGSADTADGDSEKAETAGSPAGGEESSRTVTYRGQEYDPSEIGSASPAAEGDDEESSRTVTYRGREYDPSELGSISAADGGEEDADTDDDDEDSGRTVTYRGQEYDPSEIG